MEPDEDTPAEANIGPNGEITALAVGFGHLVPHDTITIDRRVESAEGELTFEFPVAGLAPWLCLKSDALMRRNKPKDAYDIVWTLDALGPDEASARVAGSPLLAGPLANEVRVQMRRLITDQFRNERSIGPKQYATFLETPDDEAVRRHAVGTLSAFGRALGVRDLE